MKKSIHKFTFALTPDNSAGGDGTKISGVAYSGGMLPSYGWLGDCAIDLSSITVPDSVPLLVDHEAEVSAVAGRVVPTVSGGQLSINGEIFADVPSGDLVKKLLDRGFPLELSVGIMASIEEYSPPKQITVNGQTLTVNALFTSASLQEVSVVIYGADPNTELANFGRNRQEEGDNMELAQALAERDAAQAELTGLKEAHASLSAQLDEFKAQFAAIRKDEVKAVFAAVGREYSEERAKLYEAMDRQTFAAWREDVTALAAKPKHEFKRADIQAAPAEKSGLMTAIEQLKGGKQ